MKYIAAFFVALFLVTTPLNGAPGRKQVGWRKPSKITAKVIHCNIETHGLNDHTITGNRLSTRLCSSDDLPLGTKVFIAYAVRKGKKWVKETEYWFVADRPKHKSKRHTLIEPYIHRRDERRFLKLFEGIRKVTTIKPIYR